MTDQPEPIRKSALPCTPPTEYEFSTVLTGRPDGHSGVMLLPGDIGSVVVRRTVSYGDWEPVRPTRWAAEEEPSDCSTAVPIDATYATPQPTPAPSALRDLYAAAIASYDHAVGQATNPAPRGHHHGQADAVLAIRDRELEQLRAQVARVQELCANYERWQSEGWHPQQVTPGQAAREFRAALDPQEES